MLFRSALLPQIAYVVVGMLLFGRFSLEAAALVWASRLVLGLSIDLWLLKRVTGMSAALQLSGAARPALAAVAMMAMVYGAKLYMFADFEPAFRLALMVIIGAVSYVGILWLLNRSLVLEILAFGRQTVAGRS